MNKFLFILLPLLLSGCFADKLQSLVDAEFPPVNIAEHRKDAISSAIQTLGMMREPTIAANIPIDRIQDIISQLNLEKFAITEVELSAEKQFLFVDLKIGGVINSSVVAGLSDTERGILDSASPKIAGVLRLGMSLKAEAELSAENEPYITLTLLPIFREVRIDTLEILGAVDVAEPAIFLAKVVNNYADNLSGELSRLEVTKLRFPSHPTHSLDLTRTKVDEGEDGIRTELALTGNIINSPVSIKSAAFLIDKSAVQVLIELTIDPTVVDPIPPKPSLEGTSYAQLEEAYNTIRGALVLDTEISSTIWAAISKTFVASTLNQVVNEAEMCFTASAKMERETFSETIVLPDDSVFDCTPTKECLPEDPCIFDHVSCLQPSCSDNTNCSYSNMNCGGSQGCPEVCLAGHLPWPLSGCLTHEVPEPGCVSIRRGECVTRKLALQTACRLGVDEALGLCQANNLVLQGVCEAGKAVDIAECVKEEAGKFAVCQSLQVAERTTCESAKLTLNTLAASGDLASINGYAQADGTLKVCLSNLEISQDFSSIALDLNTQGSATADVGVKYVPKGIVGHAVCHAQWTEDKSIDVAVPGQNISITSEMVFETTEEDLEISAEIVTSSLRAEIDPSPRSLFLENYNMTLSCPAAGPLLHTADFIAEVLIPVMDGNLRLPPQTLETSFTVKPMEFEIEGLPQQLKTSISVVKNSILLTME